METKYTLTLLRALLISVAAATALACISAPPPEPTPKPKADPYADFRGTWFETNEIFRVDSTPAANRGLEIAITLKKVEWTESETRDGETIRDASIILLVDQRGQTRRLRMDEGETKTIDNITIEVKKAGEDYSDSRMHYVPWVDLIVR